MQMARLTKAAVVSAGVKTEFETLATGIVSAVLVFKFSDMFYAHKKLLIFLIATLILSGCILERIFRVKDQLCDFEKNFQIEISEGFRVILREPVMLDEDITWMAGAEPSEQRVIGEELIMTYIAERKGLQANPQFDLPIELRFARLDGKYRLKEGYLGKNLTDILTDELLTQIMQSVCRAEKSLVKQQIIIDIKTLNQNLLPTRSEISDILGPPNLNLSTGHKLHYDYRLKNNDTADIVTIIEIDFDDTGERILRIKVKYLRYNLDADFESGEAILDVDIFIDRET